MIKYLKFKTNFPCSGFMFTKQLLDVHLIGFGPHYKQLILCWVYLSTFHAKIGTTKDRNGMDLKEIEDIKKRWQEHTEELYKKRSS